MRYAIGQDIDDGGKEWMTGIEIDLMSEIGVLCVQMGDPGRNGRNLVGSKIFQIKMNSMIFVVNRYFHVEEE
jgi:hypothetical protein